MMASNPSSLAVLTKCYRLREWGKPITEIGPEGRKINTQKADVWSNQLRESLNEMGSETTTYTTTKFGKSE
jgi:hypothetical protein